MLETFLTVLFSVAATIIVCVAMAQAWAWVYASPTHQDATVFVRTSDGWRIALHRYRPEHPRKGLPVILCHGLGGNRYSFDLPGAPSLARFLRDRGRDVWVVELRGSGQSDRPGILKSDVPWSWGFDDHLQKDVAAAIDCVLAHTHAAAVHWIGHSMGGMLGLSRVAAHDGSPIASVVALGAPCDFSQIPPRIFALLLRLKSALKLIHLVPTGILARISIPVLGFLPPYIQGLYHAANIDPTTARRIVTLGSAAIMSSQLWLDFGRFLETGVFATNDGAPYLELLGRSEVPMLSIAGAADLLAPPASVNSQCAQPGLSGERTYLVMGKDSGCQEDYGHMDLLLGNRADQEIYPVIADWLERYRDSEPDSSTLTTDSSGRSHEGPLC